MERKQSFISNQLSWVRGKCIGNGCFGNVHVAYNHSNGAVFAVKSVELSSSKANQIQALENEIRILSSLTSPHIVRYLNDDVSQENSTQFRNLHVEYLPGGTLADVANIDETTLRSYTYSVVSALSYLHSKNIVHCDVKGKNVLITESGEAKLADFGSAFETTASNKITPRGSPLWMAPEVLRQESQGPESDVWSLGCTVIEMITGKPAWEDHGIHSLLEIATSGSIPELPSSLSDVGRDFLTKCLNFDAKQRWSCDQLLQHPFISSFSTKNGVGGLSPRCVLDWFGDDRRDERCDISEEDQEWGRDRIGKLATNGGVNWESEGWVLVRVSEKEESSVYSDREVELVGTNWGYSDSNQVEMRVELEFKKFGGSDLCGAILRSEECFGWGEKQKLGVEIYYCGGLDCNLVLGFHIFMMLKYALILLVNEILIFLCHISWPKNLLHATFIYLKLEPIEKTKLNLRFKLFVPLQIVKVP